MEKNHRVIMPLMLVVNGILFLHRKKEAMAEKARQEAVDLSRLNLRIARARDQVRHWIQKRLKT